MRADATPSSPLLVATPTAWATAALEDPVALLDDHAHLERKAASNALELLLRGPDAEWARVLSGIACDEAEHLRLVLERLASRGGRLSRAHRNPYASALRALVRTGAGRDETLDRLLVCASIEVRSCERFEVLSAAGQDPDLRALYRGLESAERGHFRTFLALARTVAPAEVVDARWRWFLEREAEVLAAQAPGPRIHSGAG